MKLGRIGKPLPTVQLRIRLAGELNTELEAYAHYYQDKHHDQVSTTALMPEMLRAFLDSDREFRDWRRKHGTIAGSAKITSASSAAHANGKEPVS